MLLFWGSRYSYVYTVNANYLDTINLQRDNGDMIITITSALTQPKPMAAILNYSGEVIIKYELLPGINRVDVSAYKDKNCAIRIMNDKNVLVQKI